MPLRPINDNIICSDGDFGDHVTASGIIVQSTIGKSEGITPRWFKVKYIGPDVDWLEVGQWVLVQYGRWTEAFTFENEKLWKIDPNGCLMTSPEKPNVINVTGDTVIAPKKDYY